MDATPTRRRILDAALELFNRTGYAATSQTEIAATAGISQGNLTYHFPAKLDLVEALRDDARVVLSRREAPSTTDDVCTDYVHHVTSSMELVWRYRFLLRDRAQLTVRDLPRGAPPELAADLARLETLIERFRDEGLLRRTLDVDLEVLARSLWIVSRYWLDHLDEFEQLGEIEWSHHARGIDHHRAVLDPCLTAEGRRRLDEAFERASRDWLAS
ncbi:MAG: TetR/AcrR family transcriptional regulator [Ilumatobacteraceae bacterium]